MSRFNPGQATSEYVRVTAKMARDMLAEDTVRVRSVTRSRVERYKRVLKAGKWLPGWDGIAYSTSGKRLNGEHRLTAIAESGKSAWLLIIRGLPEESINIGDQGIKRTTRQILAHNGEPSPGALAAALRNIWQWRNGFQIADRAQGAAADPTEMIELLHQEPGLRDAIPLGLKLRRHTALGSDGLGVTLVHLFMETDPDEAEVFFEQFTSGTNLQDGDPILVLRAALDRLKGQSAAHKGTDSTYKAALVIKAFNYWRAGHRIQQIGWRRGGRNAEPFPAIEPARENERSLVPRPDPAHRVETAEPRS